MEGGTEREWGIDASRRGFYSLGRREAGQRLTSAAASDLFVYTQGTLRRASSLVQPSRPSSCSARSRLQTRTDSLICVDMYL